MSGGHSHSYHLVEPSPWPAVGAMAAFLLAIGSIMYMHEMPFGGSIAIFGFLAILFTMYMWWRDVIKEAEYQGHHTPIVQLGMRYGMLLFIASEVMFFLAFFWAFFDASLYPDTGVWPPADVEPFAAFDIPLINTMILLLSGCTVTWAHAALLKGDRENLIKALGVTIVLGAAFTALQAYEYQHATFGFTDGIYSSTFYLATGFHGFHVLVGTCFLIVCWFRARAGHFTPEHHFGFEAAAWYWHFVDVVWLFLFICIYWWGGR
ncbi:MAG: cytochrome c oxidase subunit 3 [Alphaproteobacteria bacterium]|jgi:cytochrome c oxidase subunit III|nr:cytochrome c oxidase subunit 3 [Alphaproteobacteria bacterium]